MAARAIWKGVLRIGDESVPVKLYSAVEDRSVHFRLLAAKTHEPVHQRMVHPSTGEVVEYQAAQRGARLDDGSYVVLHKEDFERIEPKPSRDIALSRFVPEGTVSHAYFFRPYYVGPDGNEHAYFALHRALLEEKREGIAHWTMRNTEYTGLLRAEAECLMLMTLRHEDEVIPLSALPPAEGRAHTDKEEAMAEQLVQSFSDVLDMSSYHDEHRERVLELIDQKAHGKRPHLKKALPKKAEPNLADALAQSLALHEKKTAEARR